jgi:hypothetical protein
VNTRPDVGDLGRRNSPRVHDALETAFTISGLSNPADFQLAERFNPPSVRPSFDCRMAHDQIENAICGNEQPAALDLEMADQYRRMHVSYDTVGNREQLRDLQRMWLACLEIRKLR